MKETKDTAPQESQAGWKETTVNVLKLLWILWIFAVCLWDFVTFYL